MKIDLKTVAKIFSYIFIPPVMTLFSFYIVSTMEQDNATTILIISFIFGFMLPISVFIFMRRRNMIINDDAVIKEERTIPYLVGILLTFIAMVVSYLTLGLEYSTLTWVVYFIVSSLITIINLYWKISAHAMGIAIPLGISIVFNSDFAIYLTIFLSLIFWSRLKLKVHTPLQLLAGALLGSMVSIIILKVLGNV